MGARPVVDRWLFASVPAERLAVFRILVGLFAGIYLAVRLPAFLATVMIWSALGLAVPFTLGLWFRAIGPAFAVALLVITTYRSSWGRLLYFENLLVLHVLIVAATRSADAYTLRLGRPRPAPVPHDPRYGWPLRLSALVTVTTYVLAGVAKLRIGGLSWLDGTSLLNHIAYSAARLEVLGGSPSPLAAPLTRHLWLFTPMAVAVLALELMAPVALIRPLRTPWVAAIWTMHAAIAASMFVVFPYPLFLVAFAPFYRLERLDPRPVLGNRGGAPSPE
jgi:hypothetical protein